MTRMRGIPRGILSGWRAVRRVEKRSLLRQLLTYVLSIVVLLGAWEVASLITNWAMTDTQINGVSRNILPGPFDTLSQVIKNAQELQRHFFASAWRLLLAILIALATAVPIGLVVGRERILDRFFSPVIYIAYAIPQVALILFFFVVFGTGSATMVAMVALALFFQVLVSARGAAKNVAVEHLTSVLSAGATRWQVYRHVILPASLPSILTSVRVSIGLGIAFLYIAETNAALGNGLGAYIKRYMLFQRDRAFAGIVAMALLGLFLYILIDVIERVACRWKYTSRGSS
jgi:ABC-type nitrate/sulfonate/bicarbonate transport system permease component